MAHRIGRVINDGRTVTQASGFGRPGCSAAREAHRSVHVVPAIDPDRTIVTVVGGNDGPDGPEGTLVITPIDPYGNPIGPGRGDLFVVSPLPGPPTTSAQKVPAAKQQHRGQCRHSDTTWALRLASVGIVSEPRGSVPTFGHDLSANTPLGRCRHPDTR